MKIHKNGFWESEVLHHTDKGLLNTLPPLLKNMKSVVDFGCGDASYIKKIKQRYPDKLVKGYDGNPYVGKISGNFATQLDLTQPFKLDNKFDVVMSLEVAEHIPLEYERIYVDNLIKHVNKYLIISWAIPGQGGKGHVNEKDNEYVIDLFKGLGFKYNESVSNKLRSVITNCKWFKNTLFLFSKN